MLYYTVDYKKQEIITHYCSDCATDDDITPDIHQQLCKLHKEWWSGESEAFEAPEESMRP